MNDVINCQDKTCERNSNNSTIHELEYDCGPTKQVITICDNHFMYYTQTDPMFGMFNVSHTTFHKGIRENAEKLVHMEVDGLVI